MKGKLLPIGTVVKLEGSSKNVMITGYYSKSDDKSRIYTYNGCLYPEGFMENRFFFFDGPQIEDVLYRGLENEELDKHLQKLSDMTISNSGTVSVEQGSSVDKKGRRGRAPKAPNKPMSASEMFAKYTTEQISGGQTEKFDFSKLQK